MCDTLKNYKIVSLAVYEINKDSEIFLGITTKNQNIVYLNMMKQFYTSNSAIKMIPTLEVLTTITIVVSCPMMKYSLKQ